MLFEYLKIPQKVVGDQYNHVLVGRVTLTLIIT